MFKKEARKKFEEMDSQIETINDTLVVQQHKWRTEMCVLTDLMEEQLDAIRKEFEEAYGVVPVVITSGKEKVLDG